jgi:DNA-binding MarR family transcriptional regulator
MLTNAALTRKTSAPHPRVELGSLPGHCIRRLQQIAVALFMKDSAEAGGVTPVQFAALLTVSEQPGIDQRTLASEVSFDTSTIGGVIDRLEARGLLTRSQHAGDRRVRLLHLTPLGEKLLALLMPAMRHTQERMLDPLSAAERKVFMKMIQRIIEHHDELAAADRAGS